MPFTVVSSWTQGLRGIWFKGRFGKAGEKATIVFWGQKKKKKQKTFSFRIPAIICLLLLFFFLLPIFMGKVSNTHRVECDELYESIRCQWSLAFLVVHWLIFCVPTAGDVGSIPAQGSSACHVRVCSATQSCLTLFDPMNCSLPGSFVHGILQARILECVTISISRGSSWSRDRIRVFCIGRQILSQWTTREALCMLWGEAKKKKILIKKRERDINDL